MGKSKQNPSPYDLKNKTENKKWHTREANKLIVRVGLVSTRVAI
jgi:hypothetical protein